MLFFLSFYKLPQRRAEASVSSRLILQTASQLEGYSQLHQHRVRLSAPLACRLESGSGTVLGKVVAISPASRAEGIAGDLASALGGSVAFESSLMSACERYRPVRVLL